MISITAVSTSHLINSSVAESDSKPGGDLQTPTPPDGTASRPLSAMNNVAPLGGFHPIANSPGTALFGFIADAARAAIEKSNPEPQRPTSGDEMKKHMMWEAGRLDALRAGTPWPADFPGGF
jgi:hypothetical protein